MRPDRSRDKRAVSMDLEIPAIADDIKQPGLSDAPISFA
jgi:hypothetical protein